jgi:hypothetical protein
LGPSDSSVEGVYGSPRDPNGRGIGRGELMRMVREQKERTEGENRRRGKKERGKKIIRGGSKVRIA